MLGKCSANQQMLLKQSSWFCVGRRAVTSHSLQLSGLLLCEESVTLLGMSTGCLPQDVPVGFVGSCFRACSAWELSLLPQPLSPQENVPVTT